MLAMASVSFYNIQTNMAMRSFFSYINSDSIIFPSYLDMLILV